MKLNKILITVILTLSLILSIFTNVYAEDVRATVTLTLDSSSSYKVGEEIIINLDVDVIGMDGILLFYADVDYSKEVLEYKGLTAKSGWNVLDDEDNVYLEKSGIKDDKGQIGQLKFKVLKDDADTTIRLINIDSAGTGGPIHSMLNNVNEPRITLKAIPAPDEPGTDEPGTDEPGTDEPGTDEPGTDKPGTDNPGTDEPGTDEPGTDEPGTDEPGTDNPGTDEPGTDEPGTDKPGTNKPGTTNDKKPSNDGDDTKAPSKIPQTGSIAFGIIIVPFAGVAIFLLIKYIRLAMIVK